MTSSDIRLVLVLALGLGTTACEPGTAVLVVGDEGAVRFDFVNCSDARAFPVTELSVRAATEDAPRCTLELLHQGKYLTGSWRYGTPVDGYAMRGCGPLERGGTCEVSARRAPPGARSRFTIAADGAVTMLDGGCR